MLNNIEFNPYRILGVFSNSPMKDVIANEGKINAFLKVGKSVNFPLDLTTLLPAIERNVELVAKAKSQIALPAEKIRHAQFWFLNKNNIDEIAFNHLTTGNINEADNIWSKKDSVSSLQNRITLNLIQNNLQTVFSLADKLYSTFSNDYVKYIDSSLLIKLSKKELIQQFLDTLTAAFESKTLLQYITNDDWKSYIESNEASEILEQLHSLVDKTKEVDHNDPEKRLNAGISLMNSSQPLLEKLRTLLSVNDVQYQMIADKVGLEVLYCAIDHYNKSDNASLVAQEAMTLELYANEIVCGTMAKEKCETNVNILKNNIESRPPQEVNEENKELISLVENFENDYHNNKTIKTFIKKSKNLLKTIRKKIGESHPFYLKVSTSICNTALNAIIRFVNESLDFEESLPPGSAFYIDEYNARVRQHNANIKKARKSLKHAWRLSKILDKFHVKDEFKIRLIENKKSLRKLCNNSDVFINFKDNVIFNKYSNSIKRFNKSLSRDLADIGILGLIFLVIPLTLFALVWIFELLAGCIIKLCSKEYKEEHLKSILILLASAIVIALSIIGINWYNNSNNSNDTDLYYDEFTEPTSFFDNDRIGDDFIQQSNPSNKSYQQFDKLT